VDECISLPVGLTARAAVAFLAVGGGLLTARERLFVVGPCKNMTKCLKLQILVPISTQDYYIN